MSTPTVAVLGTGVMGAGMARSLRRAGLPVRAWNRDAAKARALADSGAQAFDSPAEAVQGADVLLTMLFDTDAVLDVVRQAEAPAGTVWLQTTTVGIEGAQRTSELADELGLVLVDAPVLGTRKPAEDGALVMLASGPEEVRAGLQSVLDAIGSRTLWLGAAGAGSRLKLVCNAWVLSLTAGIAQSVTLAQGVGLDPHDFLAAIAGGAADAPYAHVKGAAMIDDEFPVSFSLAGATKDARLIRTAIERPAWAISWRWRCCSRWRTHRQPSRTHTPSTCPRSSPPSALAGDRSAVGRQVAGRVAAGRRPVSQPPLHRPGVAPLQLVQ